jgi:cytochrome c oxidase assembly factor CtaG
MPAMNWLFDSSICYGAGTPQSTWTLTPMILGPLLLVALLYGIGAVRLWGRSSRARPHRLVQASLFGAGWLVLAAALISPIHALSERVFAAHMIEHELMMALAAPLIAAAAPGGALIWALPAGARRFLGRAAHDGTLARVLGLLTRPAVATVLHGLAIWVWHVPGLFEAALERGPLHYAQHASFLGTALLFWWVMLRKAQSGRAVLHLFFTSLHTGLLGVLLVVSARLWYPANALDSGLWGLGALEDQQLAGLIMWVPAGLVYALAALLLAGRWIARSAKGDRHALRPA